MLLGPSPTLAVVILRRRIESGKRASALIAISAVLIACSSLTVNAQRSVRVRGRSSLDLVVEQREGTAVAIVTLRDDQGTPLAGESVRLEESGSRPSVLQTDDEGQAEFPLRMRAQEQVSVAFSGTTLLEPIQIERNVDSRFADTRVRLEVEGGPRIDLDEAEHVLRVMVAGAATGGGLPVRIETELGEEVASGTTNAAGVFATRVSSNLLGAAGAGTLLASTSGDERRAPGRAALRIVRSRSTTTTIEMVDGVQPAALQPETPFEVEVSLQTAAGPLRQHAVELELGGVSGNERWTRMTNGEGRARFEISGLAEAESATLSARFAGDALGLRASESEPLQMQVRQPNAFERVLRYWPLLLLLVIAFTLYFARATAKTEEELTTRRETKAPGIALSQSRIGQRRVAISGEVRDAWRDELLPGTLIVDGGEPIAHDGRFLLELEEGEHVVEWLAERYAPAKATVPVPHRGQWDAAVVRLESWRAKILSPYREALRLIRPALRFERETLRTMHEQEEGSLASLGLDVESAFYGSEPPNAKVLKEVEDRAQRLSQDRERE